MKKSIISIMIFMSIFMVIAVSAQPINTTNYTISSNYQGMAVTQLKYTPYPANPGDYVDIWVEAQDYGSASPLNATFILQQSFPFSLDPGQSAVQSFGRVGSNLMLIHYKVKIDPNAVPGDNVLYLAYSPNGASNAVIETPLHIDVENAQTNFDIIVQDSSSSGVSLGVANIGENTANSLIVKIPDQANYRVTGTTNGQILGNLNAGDYTLTTFQLSQVNPRNSTLEVELDYTDAIGIRRTVMKDIELNPSSSSSNYPTTGLTSENLTGTRFNSSSGNFASFNGQRAYFTRRSSITSNVWFWIVIGIIVLVGGFSAFIAIKKKKTRKKLESPSKEKIKKTKEKENSKEPDWVTSERTRKR